MAEAHLHLRPAGARRTVLGLQRAAEEWAITLGEPYANVYPGNLVYPCTLADGTPAVIKTEPQQSGDDEFISGVAALMLYGGRGMARVIRFDAERRVLLMERVLPGEELWHLPIERALRAAALVMSKLRAPPPRPHEFLDVRAFRRAWSGHVETYGGPGPIDADLFEIGERGFLEMCESSANAVVLHGDLHYGNVLSSDREEWLAIDPKGLIGEPCYEVGDLLRNRVDELFETADAVAAMRRRVEMLADLTGLDRERVRLWGLSQAVLSEIWSTEERRVSRVDMRAARLLQDIGPLG